MQRILAFALVGTVFSILSLAHPVSSDQDGAPPPATASQDQPKLTQENLLKAELDRMEDTEVIVSHVTIPPHTTLPKHWHSGEVFAYILEGLAVLRQEGKDDIVFSAGEALMVPLKQVHSAITHEEGATILVFRVHEQGQPERVLVD